MSSLEKNLNIKEDVQNLLSKMTRTKLVETVKGSIDLIIGKGKANLSNSANNITFEGRNIAIRPANQDYRYGYYNKINLAEIDNLRIFLKNEDVLMPIDLPEQMLNRLREYFIQEKILEKEEFDCHSFVAFMNNLDYNKDFASLWNAEFPVNPLQLKPGATISISTPEILFDNNVKYITHSAIYLGHDLFLSKFGNKGPLIVTNLDEMKKGFGGDLLLKSNISNKD